MKTQINIYNTKVKTKSNRQIHNQSKKDNISRERRSIKTNNLQGDNLPGEKFKQLTWLQRLSTRQR